MAVEGATQDDDDWHDIGAAGERIRGQRLIFAIIGKNDEYNKQKGTGYAMLRTCRLHLQRTGGSIETTEDLLQLISEILIIHNPCMQYQQTSTNMLGLFCSARKSQ